MRKNIAAFTEDFNGYQPAFISINSEAEGNSITVRTRTSGAMAGIMLNDEQLLQLAKDIFQHLHPVGVKVVEDDAKPKAKK